MRNASLLITLLFAIPAAEAAIVDDVRERIAAGDFAGADRLVAAFERQSGANSELAAAVSWLARGALAARNLDRAESYADRARDLALANLRGRSVDSDQWLPTALGASIEVHGQVMAARNETSSAVAFLQAELARYRNTSIADRISKNINLLSLAGKPAPSLDAREWIGSRPATLASMRGKPVLLFFWAHWCPDCKAEVPIIANLMRRYAPRGLQLVGPTKYYGYMEEGQDATPAQEKVYIQQIFDRYYSPLRSYISIPLSNANFTEYGCSSTPTLALVDKNGIVRWYHPGAATEAELAAEIEKVL
jgi:thiol-disulfide isomerase/thioredoxin